MKDIKEPVKITEKQGLLLVKLARRTIEDKFKSAESCGVKCLEGELSDDAFSQKRGVFVTLHKAGQLRGCIGSLSAHRSLSEDVAENAFAAAFRDHRFSAVNEAEIDDIEMSISVLTAPEMIVFTSESDLISQLRPGLDGLILTEGGNRGTFLPSVWENYPQADSFLAHLKMKAGLPTDYWSGTIKVERYETISW